MARGVLGHAAVRMSDVLSSLVDEGVIEAVSRPLMSGKEAQIYLVEAAGKEYVAKVYKEAANRTFKHRSDYTEGRKVRNSRDQRAIDKRSKHGRSQDESAWRSTEVDMIYRLAAAGVRVPAPYQFIDGVLIMELVRGADGEPAPRLGDARVTPEQAQSIYDQLIRETIRMLCAGVVHGDLSDFNVLLAVDGPVIIDFPQSVDPAKNQNARKLLLRDVDNLYRYVSRFVPGLRRIPYAEEMWSLYESNQLRPDTVLRGQYRDTRKQVDTQALLDLIGEEKRDADRRRPQTGATPAGTTSTVRPRRVEVVVQNTGSWGGQNARRPRRVEVVVTNPAAPSSISKSSREPRGASPTHGSGRDGPVHARSDGSRVQRPGRDAPANGRTESPRAQRAGRDAPANGRTESPRAQRAGHDAPANARADGPRVQRPGRDAPVHGRTEGAQARPANRDASVNRRDGARDQRGAHVPAPANQWRHEGSPNAPRNARPNDVVANQPAARRPGDVESGGAPRARSRRRRRSNAGVPITDSRSGGSPPHQRSQAQSPQARQPRNEAPAAGKSDSNPQSTTSRRRRPTK